MIRSSFMPFETAKRALTVNQIGLNTVGHNISNVSTMGYTRQRVDQVSMAINGYSTKYRQFGNTFGGQGALATGISQIRDPYLDARYRAEASNYGMLSTRVSGLTDIEDILDEIISENGLGTLLGNFIQQLGDFSNDTDSEELAMSVRTAAQQFVQMLNTTANQLKNTQVQQRSDLDVTVNSEVNIILEQIATLNEVIRKEHIHGNPANELLDQRNLLIDQLSEYSNIKVINTPEKISDSLTISRMSIVMVDNSVVPAEELMLVDHNSFNAFQINDNEDGTLSFSLVDGQTGGMVREDITDNFTSGVIRGYIDVLNGKGDYAAVGENGYRGIPYYMSVLDTFAETFAEQMNKVNSITAAEAAGKNTVFEADKPLFASKDGGPITAGNITLSENWIAEVGYLTKTKEDLDKEVPKLDANGEPLLDDDGNPVYEETQDNDNINKFTSLLKGTWHFRIEDGDGNKKNIFSGSPAEFITNMQNTVAQDKNIEMTKFGASELVIDNYATQRNDLSAVNIDEEAINMLTYQNYYNAAARYMTVIDEALGTIIQSMGVVGR